MALMIHSFQAEGYRSLQNIQVPVEQISVFTGSNGAGKTNLYRALQLLQAAANGRLSHELAAEGGMGSAFFAGTWQKNRPKRIVFSVVLCDSTTREPQYEYQIEIGLVPPAGAAFQMEPQVKEEVLLHRHRGRTMKLLERRNASLTLIDDTGVKVESNLDLLASETALSLVQEPGNFPGLHIVRGTLCDWRFYHDFSTERQSVLRAACLAVTSPTLDSDGANLAAVFATLAHIRGETGPLDEAIDDAFPGAVLQIPEPDRTASFGLVYAEYPKRVFDPVELSDGTLRYLALAGALLAYRLPNFIALNEPEKSLHPALLEPLARLIVSASRRTQIWVVTHSERLAEFLESEGGIAIRTVFKEDGKTWIAGLTIGGEFRDT